MGRVRHAMQAPPHPSPLRTLCRILSGLGPQHQLVCDSKSHIELEAEWSELGPLSHTEVWLAQSSSFLSLVFPPVGS